MYVCKYEILCMCVCMYVCMYCIVCMWTNQASAHQAHVCSVFHDVAHGLFHASHMTIKLQLVGLQPVHSFMRQFFLNAHKSVCMYVCTGIACGASSASSASSQLFVTLPMRSPAAGWWFGDLYVCMYVCM